MKRFRLERESTTSIWLEWKCRPIEPHNSKTATYEYSKTHLNGACTSTMMSSRQRRQSYKRCYVIRGAFLLWLDFQQREAFFSKEDDKNYS